MRIGIDLRCLEEEKKSGVGEYALELVQNILEIDSKNEYLLFSNSFKKKCNFSFFEKYPNAKIKRFRFPNKLLNFFFWYFGWPKIDRLIGGVDIFFAPNINFLALSRNCRFVATFHDLSFERFPELFFFKTRLWHHYFVNPRKIAKKAEKIIAVSESTKNDLKELYDISDENIRVIPHGISPDFREISPDDLLLQKTREKYNLPEKFILYIGNIEPRKNIPALISAYKNFTKRNPQLNIYKLVLVGNISPHYHSSIQSEENKIQVCGYIDQKDRPFLYNLASLFVYPSFFEGFGLPILETMACGTPVIASHNSSIPEVVGNTAVLVDPNRPDQISTAIEAAILDQNLSEKQAKKGIERSRQFSWKKCAEETLNAFNEIHNS